MQSAIFCDKTTSRLLSPQTVMAEHFGAILIKNAHHTHTHTLIECGAVIPCFIYDLDGRFMAYVRVPVSCDVATWSNDYT